MSRPNVITRIPGQKVKTIVTVTPTGTTSSSSTVPSLSEVTAWTSTGARRVRPKPLTPTNYYCNWQRYSAFVDAVHVTDLGGGSKRYEYDRGPAINPPSGGADIYVPGFSWDPIYNRALDKLNDKVRGNLDLAVDLAQAGQTARMFGISRSMERYVSDFTRSSSRFKALVRGISSARLEFIYGWKPLAEDLYSAADESLRVVINSNDSFNGTARQVLSPSTFTVNTVFGSVPFIVDSSSLHAFVKIGVSMYVPSFDLSRWSSLNPVSILWEALPYSFVVDWVYNVGGYLRNYETGLLQANKFRCGYVSKLVRGTVSARWTDGFWNVEGVFLDFTRTVLSSYPFPSLPRLEVNMGSSRLLNAAALLGQFLRR